MSPTEEQEAIPLGEPDIRNKGKNGYFDSKTKIVVAVVLVLLLIIALIVLAVLLAGRQKAEETELAQNDTVPTIKPPHTEASTIMAPTTAGTEAWWNPRLPSNIVPVHYGLFLNITVDQPSFDGNVVVRVEVKNATDLIILHNKKLDVRYIEVNRVDKKEILPVKKHFAFKKYDYYVIMMERILEPAKYLIKIAFGGLFTRYAAGMYRETYTRLNGEKVNFVATQFEDIHARRAFPCFDEPAMKATFNVSIAHRPDYVALSNMPIYKTEMNRHQRVNYYSRSVVMPTYLLAFVVGDFNSTEKLSSNDIMMRYYSRPSFVYKLNYAKSVGGKIMTFFENLFDMEYPLPKEDMVGIPKFPYGGMENWGLILYNENILLWDPKESTEQRKLLAVHVITHELVHMWFGNIVTLNWWNDIWLNEGFAKIFEPIGIGSVEPDWKRENLMIYKELRNSMIYDVQARSNPLSEVAQNVRSTHDMKPVIFYDKGMCILRMIQGFLDEKSFIEGMKIYLKRHAYKNTVTDDVWKALTEATCLHGKCMDVKQIMDPWTLQTGFPIVKFARKNSTHYTVSQSHFKSKYNETYRKSKFGYSWVIPLSYVIKNKGHSFTWMNMTSAVIEWNGKGWIKANTDHNGYYITNYEESNWLALADQLRRNHTVFTPSDRAGMLLDLYEFLSDQVGYSTIFTFTEYMANETEYVPWRVVFDQVETLLARLPVTSRAYRYLMKYLVFLGKKQYDRLGFQDTGTGVEKVARQFFLSRFCEANVKTCTTKAYHLFREWMKNTTKNAIPPNLRKIVYYYGISEGSLEEWDFLYNQFNKTNDKQIKEDILYGLSGSKEPWMLERFLRYLLDPWKFESRWKYYATRYFVESRPLGSQVAWSFIQANRDMLTRPGQNGCHIVAEVVHCNDNFFENVQNRIRPTSQIICLVVKFFNTEYRLQEVQRFQERTKLDLGESIRHIQKRIKWLDKNEQDIEDALEALLMKHNILFTT